MLGVSDRLWLLLSTTPQDNCPPENVSCHVSALPHQSLTAKQVDVGLDEFLAAGLKQRSTSASGSPVINVRNKSCDICIAVKCTKKKNLSSFHQLTIPRVEEVVDNLVTGRIFSLFFLVFCIYQKVVHNDKISLTALCTTHGPFRGAGYALTKQRCSSVVRLINQPGYQGPGPRRRLPHDGIAFDADLSLHVANMKELSLRLRHRNLELSPLKATIGATYEDLFVRTICPAGVMLNALNEEALTKMHVPKDLKQRPPLLGALSYYGRFLRYTVRSMRPITSLLTQGVKLVVAPEVEVIVRKLRAEWTTPLVIIYLNWDVITDNPCPFFFHCDASVDYFSATLEQGLDNHTNGSIVSISRATIESARHWTALDHDSGSIVWSIKRLRGYLRGTKFIFVLDLKALEPLDKIAEQKTRGYSEGWNSSLFTTTLWNVAKVV